MNLKKPFLAVLVALGASFSAGRVLADPDKKSGTALDAGKQVLNQGEGAGNPNGDTGNGGAITAGITDPQIIKRLDQAVPAWRDLFAAQGPQALQLLKVTNRLKAHPPEDITQPSPELEAVMQQLKNVPDDDKRKIRKIIGIMAGYDLGGGTGGKSEPTKDGTASNGGGGSVRPGGDTSGGGKESGSGSGPTYSQGTTQSPTNGQGGGKTDDSGDPARGIVNDYYNYASRNGNNNPAILNNAAMYDCRFGDAASCYDASKRAVEHGSKNAKVWVGYGASSYEMGDREAAQRAGQKALEFDPDNEAAQRLAALAPNHVTGDLSSVLKGVGFKSGGAAMGAGAPDRDVAKNTSFFGGGGFSGPSVGDGGSHMTAAELAAIATKQAQMPASNVQQSAALTREAGSDLGVRDYQGAYNLSSKAVELNPSNAQAWNFRAIADNHLQKYDDAVHDASFSLGLVPGNAPALQSRSWAFAKQGKYKEALADANFTLEKEPKNSFAYQNRAYALAGMGDRAGALEALRRSAELDPRFKDKYEAALQAPEANDLKFLFDDAPAAKAAAGAAPESSPGTRKNRFLRLFVLCISGGVLVALGLLHVVSASWRERVNTTIRRVLGNPAEAVAAAGPEGGEAAAPGTGIWSQYQVIRQVGTGGMGVVFEAKDLSLDRSVAIKKMRDEFRAEPSERQRFVTEARTVAALHHPNIVDIYSIVEDSSDVYLVFEYVSGKTVSELLSEKGTLDFDSALKVLRGACEAVDYAHRQRVIHRDIKPSNIMVTDDGRVKVMDFGVARQAKDAITKMATMTNTVVGTPPYMAPEQEQGTVRRESDVFGLGVVFYELLSGSLPFQGHGAGMLLNKINGRILPLSQQVKYGLPAGLEEVIAKSLAPDPDKRYRTPAEFLAAVEAMGASRLG